MPRKLISILLTLCALLSVFGSGYAENVDYEAIYAPVLENYYREMITAKPLQDWQDGFTGIEEAWMALDPETLLKTVGYAILDVNGDEIPELLIGEIQPGEDGESQGRYLYAMYACAEGESKIIFDGWSRNCYQLLPDGTIFNRGSNGAAYSILALYRLRENNTGLDCLDFYFTWEKDESLQEYAVYHNTTADYSKALSQEADLSVEQLWQMDDTFSSTAVDIPLTSFADAFGLPSSVSAQWGQDGEVVLTAVNGDVQELKVLEIQFASMDEWSQITYTVLSETDQGALEDGQSLALTLEFAGDLPNNAISYVDSKGIARIFTLNISGENGELFLGLY